MRRLTLVLIGILIALTGCAQVSGNPIADLFASMSGSGSGAIGGLIERDVKAANANFEQAVALGVLPATDPAPACLKMVTAALGGDGPSFKPEIDGVLSAGTIAYIRALQFMRLSGGSNQLPAACEQLLGRLFMQAARRGAGAFTGGLF